jgi:hypothetical protein
MSATGAVIAGTADASRLGMQAGARSATAAIGCGHDANGLANIT